MLYALHLYVCTYLYKHVIYTYWNTKIYVCVYVGIYMHVDIAQIFSTYSGDLNPVLHTFTTTILHVSFNIWCIRQKYWTSASKNMYVVGNQSEPVPDKWQKSQADGWNTQAWTLSLGGWALQDSLHLTYYLCNLSSDCLRNLKGRAWQRYWPQVSIPDSPRSTS